MRTTSCLALLLAAHTAAQTADKITVLEGTPGSQSLRVFAEADPKAQPSVVATGLQVLPIELTNRTAQGSFDPGRSRLVERQGLRHVALPDGGKLLRMSRGTTPPAFGFWLIRPGGEPLLVHELQGAVDPYEDRIAVAPDGRHAVLTTTAGATFVSRLDGGVFASTNSPTRPLTLPAGVKPEKQGIAVGPTHAFLITDDDRIRRCELADGRQPADVTPPGTGYRMKSELAPSGDGGIVAFLLGPKDLSSIYLLGSTGAAVKLPPPPAKYEEPGYLPEFQGGPRLLLSGDASRLLYVDSTVRDELFLLDTTGSTSTTHVTSDANFQPYIGVGILPAFAASTLVVAVGNPSAFDWFAASTSSAGVLNLTLTGNRATPPFDAGALRPVSGFLAADGALVASETLASGAVVVRRIDATGKSTLLADNLRDAMTPGASLSGTATVLLPGHNGDALLGSSPSTPIVQGPPGVHLSVEVQDRTGTYTAFTASDPVSGATLPVLRLGSAGIFVFPPVPGLRQIALTRAGGAVLDAGQLRYLAPGVDVTFGGAAAQRVVLSGAW